MKSREPHDKIGDLLRAHKPAPRPSAELEARIIRSLGEPEPAKVSRVWPWFLLPPAVAAAIVLMWPDPAAVPVLTGADPAPAQTNHRVEAPVAVASNPLEREKLALENDARRASRFLMECLPSLTLPLD
jgi:hypothetical protein